MTGRACVKTSVEMEGRFEERWALVEDDGRRAWGEDEELAVVGHAGARA